MAFGHSSSFTECHEGFFARVRCLNTLLVNQFFSLSEETAGKEGNVLMKKS
jgi:hypothetical protein